MGVGCLVIIAFGIFFFAGSSNVYAKDIVTIGNDNLKFYDSALQEVTIKDSDNKSLVNIKLLTPLDNHVGIGYQKVAEYEISSIENLKLLVSKMEFYDKSKSMNEITRTIDYKIKVIKQVVVNDYKSSCKSGIYENCTKTLIGSHFENKTTWINLDKVDFIRDEKIIVGLYTDVQKGDKIEWIPTFHINDKTKVRIEELASWTESLNTGLINYLAFEETTGTVVVDSTNNQNGTNVGLDINQNGKIGKGYSIAAIEGKYITLTGITSTTQNYTYSIWMNVTNTVGAFRFLLDFQTGRLSAMIQGSDGKMGIYDGGFSSSGTAVTLNSWVHYLWTIDGSRGKANLYINGVKQTEMTCAARNLGGAVRFAAIHDSTAQEWAGSVDEAGLWERVLADSEIAQLYNDGAGMTYTTDFKVDCIFSGFVKDEGGTALAGANVTIWNQYDTSEVYSNTTNAEGSWKYSLTNSTNTYMVGAYYNDTLIGQLKPYISGTC